MKALIAESQESLSLIWAQHLERLGVEVERAHAPSDIMRKLHLHEFDAVIMNLKFPNASVLALSDLATYRNPKVAIILVTADRFFSDGSIFDLVPNARGFVNDKVKPDDLAAMIEHFAA